MTRPYAEYRIMPSGDVCELYDLRQDPDELNNMATVQTTRAMVMKAGLREWCPIPVAVA